MLGFGSPPPIPARDRDETIQRPSNSNIFFPVDVFEFFISSEFLLLSTRLSDSTLLRGDEEWVLFSPFRRLWAEGREEEGAGSIFEQRGGGRAGADGRSEAWRKRGGGPLNFEGWKKKEGNARRREGRET